ncbi:MBL fold metallo-hydrolase [Anaeromicropila herbilytica]|uniref:MBL fold hydrolase n=1 Tax=Anaeromicropila herbilytica TaxID=2785025 RepID=A0A7R7EJH9_9FIRM|nr:MBL fold metallo-hydrolase [Anaeromicropila herbilytica]BCN29925.1 MBL fold hydrolase [Anaeromicropila herbilytica]
MNINRLTLGMVSTNCYIISNPNTKEAIVFDPADNASDIIQFIKKEELTLVGILLTHGHFDHILAVRELANECKVSIYAGEHEKDLLEDPYMNCSLTMGGKSFTVQADTWLMDKEIINLAGFDIEVIHTPGHTGGGVCYLFSKEGVLVSGDTLFEESIGRADLPTGNQQVLLDTIKNKLFVLDDHIMVLPGHSDTTTIGHEKQNNPYIG